MKDIYELAFPPSDPQCYCSCCKRINQWGSDFNCPVTEKFSLDALIKGDEGGHYSLFGKNNVFQIYPLNPEKILHYLNQTNATSALHIWAEEEGAGMVILNNTGANGQQFDLEMENEDMIVPDDVPRELYVKPADLDTLKLGTIEQFLCNNTKMYY